MKNLFFTAMLALLPLCMQAQTKAGGISTEMLRQIRPQQTAAAADRALRNVAAQTSIDDIARNFKNNGPVDAHFSVETPYQNIQDQKSSGRCWMFSGLNVLRSNFARRHQDTLRVEFSHAYLFFYDQLEKSNLFLQGVIDSARKPMDDTRVQFFFRHPLSDGGTFCGVADLTEKYGLVPAEVQPETFSAENTSRMASLLSSKLREFGLELRQMVQEGRQPKALEARKTEMLATVWHMLSLTLGEPVKEFDYAFKNSTGHPVSAQRHYTPQEFYAATVGAPLNGSFIMAMNDPRRPYYETFEVELDRHVYDGHNWCYVNLPMEDIEAMAIASLRDSTKLYTSYDVGKQLDRKRGLLDLNNFDYETLLGTSFTMDKAQRIATFDSGSTHAMTLTAVDLDADGKPLRWKVENSWGPSYGHAGCLIMTSDWFREYTFRLVVDKKYVPARILQAAAKKPTLVAPEDPLFAEDR